MRKWWIVGLLVVALVSAQTALAQDAQQGGSDAPVVAGQGLFTSAQTALDSEDYDRAVLNLSLFILLNPTNSQGYYLRGVSYLGRGDGDAAVADLNAAIQYAPEDVFTAAYRADLFTTRANIYLSLEDTDTALDDLTLAIEVDPTTDRYLSRAGFHARLEDLDSALEDVDSAIGLGDTAELPRLYLIRASVNFLREDGSAAAADYYNFVGVIGQETRQTDPLPENQPVSLPMTQGLVYRIPITAQTGESFSAIAAPAEDSQVDPLIVLLAPDGTPLVGIDDINQTDLSALIEDYALPESGEYTLIVTHSGGGAEGDLVVVYLVN